MHKNRINNVVEHCHQALVSLHDRLYREQPHNNLFLDRIATLIESFENLYSFYIPNENTIPRYVQKKTHMELSNRIFDVIALLGQKNIPQIYLNELHYAIDSLFTHGKLPELQFSHISYLDIFFTALEDLATDRREKDWNTRFIFILINFNFNHMGIFNRWSEQLRDKISKASNAEEVEKIFTSYQDILRMPSSNPTYAYDPNRLSLADHMQHYISDLKKEIKKSKDSHSREESTSILTNLNADELTIIFHYLYKTKMLNYKTKREAAQTFANNIESKTGRKISYKTLEKFDKPALEHAAYSIRRNLLKILNLLKEDF